MDAPPELFPHVLCAPMLIHFLVSLLGPNLNCSSGKLEGECAETEDQLRLMLQDQFPQRDYFCLNSSVPSNQARWGLDGAVLHGIPNVDRISVNPPAAFSI